MGMTKGNHTSPSQAHSEIAWPLLTDSRWHFHGGGWGVALGTTHMPGMCLCVGQRSGNAWIPEGQEHLNNAVIWLPVEQGRLVFTQCFVLRDPSAPPVLFSELHSHPWADTPAPAHAPVPASRLAFQIAFQPLIRTQLPCP